MSRGPGEVQRAILDYVREHESDELAVTKESMRWGLWKQTEGIKILNCPDLPRSWNSSHDRAIKGLAENGKIVITERRLQSLAECVAHYPGKTLDGQQHRVRTVLLPELLDWSKDICGVGPRYNLTANEEYSLRNSDEDKVLEMSQTWRRLERSLRRIYGTSSDDSDCLLMLLARGAQLFKLGHVSVSHSFCDLVDRVMSKGLVDKHVALGIDLLAFRSIFMPSSKVEALNFKSYVFQFVTVSSTDRCELKLETMEYLLQKQTDFVEKLPGHKKPQSQNVYFPFEPDFSPVLRKMVTHSVFQKFKFISIE